MPDATDYMRHLVITADAGVDIRAALSTIPGYKCVPLEEEVQRRIGRLSSTERFYLQADANGERIVICHRLGETEARTSNVMEQDQRAQHVPLWNDELVILRRAIKQVPGISAAVIAAEVDLLPPTT